MSNLIILEGPDGGGKTTLAKKLVARGYRYVHHGPPGANEDLFQRDLGALRGAVEPTVIDRLHLSENIYGPITRGMSRTTSLQERLIGRYAEALDAQVVICLPPYRVVLRNWLKNRKNELLQTPGQLRQVYQGYLRLLHAGRPYVWFDHTRYQVGAFAAALIALKGKPLPYGVVGAQAPRFLFVGERPAKGKSDLPFLDDKRCSGWLNDALWDAGYEEGEMAFVNAYRADGMATGLRTVFGCFETPPTVIALGQVAAKQLDHYLVDHQALPHPQFHKRFKAKDRDRYVRGLAHLRRSSR